MSNNHKQEKSTPLKDAAPGAPVITWEQALEEEPTHDNSKVIPLEAYRRQNESELEATFNVRTIPAIQGEEPIRLIVVSSGFGQKLPANPYTVQSKAAA
ncbi:hypothetical protein [Paenibacillus aceris]|uniref:Uncharacterized protein n=1 Tax=Paenibacillus aceris TaxID=869555 RepID=A0ABS4I7L9_9BACL|nr:hypothetical protein [Paenibacillus aceris]MBP1966855.1 hypothetical protein [Paenibacillus aceris]NHW38926.1 hypothetical protein [Paenibacillus aceris]